MAVEEIEEEASGVIHGQLGHLSAFRTWTASVRGRTHFGDEHGSLSRYPALDRQYAAGRAADVRHRPCKLFVKLESQNPGGSIKDRIGRSMIEAAERDGKIGPGSVLVEATAGNTGLGLALVAAQKGYRLILVIPDKMSQEKVFHLKALGAEVVMTRSDVGKGHPQYYQDLAENITRETPQRSTSTSSTIRPIRWPTRPRPARRSGPRPATTSTRSSAASARAARSPG